MGTWPHSHDRIVGSAYVVGTEMAEGYEPPSMSLNPAAHSASDELANARELRNVLSGHLADALGRAERAEAAIERLADMLERYAGNYPESVFPSDSTSHDAIGGTAMRHAYRNAARMVREAVEAAPMARVAWVSTLGVSPAGPHSIAEIMPDSTQPDTPAPAEGGTRPRPILSAVPVDREERTDG